MKLLIADILLYFTFTLIYVTLQVENKHKMILLFINHMDHFNRNDDALRVRLNPI